MSDDTIESELTPAQERFQIMDIELSPAQALFLDRFIELLDFESAAKAAKVFIERHMRWMVEDEEYVKGFNHAIEVIRLKAESVLLRSSLIGMRNGKSRKFNMNGLERILDSGYTPFKKLSPEDPAPLPSHTTTNTVFVLPSLDDIPQIRYTPSEEPQPGDAIPV